MSTKRLLVLGLLGSILLVGLLSTNLVFVADRTVLNEEFVKDTASEEELYASLHTEIGSEIVPESPETPEGVPLELSEEEVMNDIITEAYVEDQVNENIDQVYEYLHGDEDEIQLYVETEVMKNNFESVLEEKLQTLSAGDIGYEEVEQWKESEEAYDAGREEKLDELRTQIQEETEEELSEEEIEAVIEDREDEFREELVDQVTEQVPEEQVPPGGDDALVIIGNAVADGVLTDQSHTEFVSAVNTGEEQLREAMVADLMSTIDEEVPAQVDVMEEANNDDLAPLETGRTIVNGLGMLKIILPLLSIGLVTSIAWVAPRYSTAAFEIGGVALLVGVSGIIMGRLVSNEVRRFIGSEDIPQGLADFIIGLVSNTSDILFQQSIVLFGIGILAILIGGVIRFELLPDGTIEKWDID